MSSRRPRIHRHDLAADAALYADINKLCCSRCGDLPGSCLCNTAEVDEYNRGPEVDAAIDEANDDAREASR